MHSTPSRKTYAFIDHQNISINAQRHQQQINYHVLDEVLKTKYHVDAVFLFDCLYGPHITQEMTRELQKYDFYLDIRMPSISPQNKIETNIDDYLLEQVRKTRNYHHTTLVMTSDVGLIHKTRRMVRNNVFHALVDARTITYGIEGVDTVSINTSDFSAKPLFTKQRKLASWKDERYISAGGSAWWHERRLRQRQKLELLIKAEELLNLETDVYFRAGSRKNKSCLKYI